MGSRGRDGDLLIGMQRQQQDLAELAQMRQESERVRSADSLSSWVEAGLYCVLFLVDKWVQD